MRCAACAFENPPGSRYCGGCGESLGSKCASCGSVNPPEFRFCGSCGASIEPAGAAVSTEERKVVTVLFADLVGFTRRAEQLDPEDVRAVLHPYYSRLRREIERFGGTVEKFIGDAVMALFGAPVVHEDDPERAVRAAFAVREAITELNETDPALDLHVRMGIATGEVVVLLEARPNEGEGMAAGDVVNTAARLQAAAPVDSILVTAATHRATRQAIDYGSVEPIRAKGKVESIEAWEAIAPRSRLGVDVVPRGAARLVGRTAELTAVRDAFERARAARCSQLITLVGVPGIGKTRLVSEFFRALADDPDPAFVYWRQGRSLPYGEGVTYWALAEIAKAQAGILETDPAEVAQAKLRDVVRELFGGAADATWVEGALRPLVGLGGDADPGRERRAETFAAWRRFFEALAERRPLVVVFEDLHWADDGLLDFIEYLVEWSSDVPMFVVATARPELLDRRPGWGGGKRNSATISLPPLTDEDIGAIVADLTRHVRLDGAADRLLVQAGGNPLYAEEYVRMLLSREGDAAAELPASIHGIIAARIDSLPREEKQLLQDAAVVGKGFWVGALAAVGELPRWSVEERLQPLVRKEFVRRERESSVAGEVQYAFLHVLVRDVAYGQIPRAARAEKHRLAAEWIESLAVDRPEDHAEMRAHHYAQSLALSRDAGLVIDFGQKARLALREAGDRAAALHAFDAAARFYGDALELWPDDEERAHVLFRYGRALFDSDVAGADVLREAGERLIAAGDAETAAEAEMVMGELSWMRGHRDEASAHFDRAAALVVDAPPSRSKTYVLGNLARFRMTADENDEAIRVGAAALEMAESLRLDELRSHALATTGVARIILGDGHGIHDLEQSIAIARKLGSPQVVRGLNNLASMQAQLGNLAAAFEVYAQARSAAERYGMAGPIRWLLVEQVREHYWTGAWDEALAAAEQLIASVETGNPSIQAVDAYGIRARIALGRGDAAAALTDSERALTFARDAKDPQILFPALACRSVVLSAGAPDEAGGLAAELLDRWRATNSIGAAWLPDLARAMTELGREDELLAAAIQQRAPTRWLDAARDFCSHDFGHAAAVYGDIGSRPDEAYALLCAGEQRFAAGSRAEGERCLAHALDLFRVAGASAYADRAESLLGAPA